MKKIMLIGDSIRMSYQEKVKQLLSGKADVWGPDDNCRFAKYTLNSCNAWFDAAGKPDIVHWNNGIWDVARVSMTDREPLTSLDEYLKTLERILCEWNVRNLTVVWANTTAVLPNHPRIENETLDSYNAAAAEFMSGKGIPITDLNSVIKNNAAAYLIEDGVHLSAAGIDACASEVVKSLERFL